MDSVVITGILASVLTAFSLLPQLIKLLKEKEAGSISTGMLVILLLGLLCWIYYGWLRKDWVILCSNACSLLMNVLTLVLSLKYKAGKPASKAK